VPLENSSLGTVIELAERLETLGFEYETWSHAETDGSETVFVRIESTDLAPHYTYKCTHGPTLAAALEAAIEWWLE
jgi:hypothetical protein